MLTLLDSGVGAWFVFLALRQKGFGGEVQIIMDSLHFPYGDKSPQWLMTRARQLLKRFNSLDQVVIACNTLSLHVPSDLRASVLTIDPRWYQTEQALILATTASSRRLREENPAATVLALPDVAGLVEIGQIDAAANELTSKLPHWVGKAVLACTHYSPLAQAIHNQRPYLEIIDTVSLLAEKCLDTFNQSGPTQVTLFHPKPESLSSILGLYRGTEPVYLEVWHD